MNFNDILAEQIEREREQAAAPRGAPNRQEQAQAYYNRLRQQSAMQPSSGFSQLVDHVYNNQAAQAAHLQGAAGNVMGAMQDENQSRVSQAREMRRMEHEKELMRMKSQSDIYGAAIRSLLG